MAGFDRSIVLSEFPTRYQLDEARFAGGSERVRGERGARE